MALTSPILLNEAAKRFNLIAEELEISPDEGKHYA